MRIKRRLKATVNKYDDIYEKMYISYMDYNDARWDSKTYKVEASKLKTILAAVRQSGLSGMEFYKELVSMGYKPYTIKALFQTAALLFAHAQKEKITSNITNPFEDFLTKNNHIFRHAYKVERLKFDFDEARRRINTLEDANIREFCLAILHSGLRISEAYKVNHDTQSVIGKGGKQRFVMFDYKGDQPPPGQARVRTALASIELKPHSLRKLLATKLSRDSSLTHIDIMTIMGWSSIETAQKYMQPLAEQELKQKVLDALNK